MEYTMDFFWFILGIVLVITGIFSIKISAK